MIPYRGCNRYRATARRADRSARTEVQIACHFKRRTTAFAGMRSRIVLTDKRLRHAAKKNIDQIISPTTRNTTADRQKPPR